MRDPYLRTLRAVPAPLPGSEAGARLTQYRLLNLLSDTLLTEGFPGRTHHASDVGRSLDYLVKPLGTIAENVFEHEKYTPAVSVSGTWSHRDAGEHRFPDNEVEGEGSGRRDSSWWSRPDTLLERDDPEHLALIDAETRRQGINPRSHRANEAYASMSRLVYARQLEEEAAGVADLLPAPGLEPSAPDRLVRVAPLLVLATRTLGEQFHPGQLAPDEVLTVLEPVARSIGRRIL
jgi:hypothetical protein